MEAKTFIFIFLINLVIILNLQNANGYEDIQTNAAVVWGNVNETTRIFVQRYYEYPPPGWFAFGVGSFSSTMIRGMILTRKNNTEGIWILRNGGVGQTFADFEFRGAGVGRAFDFVLEIFGTGATKSNSVFLITLSSAIMIIKYFMY
ncbi:unnamed protein product [Chironomus riparius]|uniref:DOMON domain-containing protein n=1 Tax=Chironomus riparius TaxID=315576 RepID=A0A9N9RHY5_9DIPT|nr:unnamed protein product [Chironomus riparius]